MNVLSPDLIEVRLFGPLSVRRPDGSMVEAQEWRTRKTLELFRILALNAGEPVSVDRLLDLLWPGADPERGRASLRTAASQVRRVLRSDGITRHRQGLMLDGVWVDTHTFMAKTRECRQAQLEGRFADAVAAARQADALYLHDLEVVEPQSVDLAGWFEAEQRKLRTAHTALMVEAGAAAVSMGWMRDATDFAGRALEADPFSESAYRTGMLGHVGLGEVAEALALYERCKRLLADELGVAPSSQTQAVYLQSLRSAPQLPELSAPFVGRQSDLAWMHRQLTERAESGGCCVVVAGPARAGASRLVEETVGGLGAPVHRLHAPVTDVLQLGAEAPVVLVDGVECWPPGDLQRLALSLSATRAAPVLLAVHRLGVNPRADDELSGMAAAGQVQLLTLKPLTSSEVAQLAHQLLSGSPTPELVKRLAGQTGGLPGEVVSTVGEWLSTGHLVHTGRGLDVITDEPTADLTTVYRQLRALHSDLTPWQLAVLEVIAVLGAGVTAEAVAVVLAPAKEAPSEDAAPLLRAPEVEQVLFYLEEHALLAPDNNGRFTFKSPLLRDIVRGWMRPATLRRLHRNAAERLRLSAGSRVIHWLGAGEPRLACAAALEAATDAMTTRRFAEARAHLLQVHDLTDEGTAEPMDRLELLKQLAMCSEHLGLENEALDCWAAARELATAHNLPVETRESVVAASVGVLHAGTPSLLERLGVSAATAPTAEVESLLRSALASAVRRGDDSDAAEARLLLAGLVLFPQRRFAEARRLVAQAQRGPLPSPHEALAVVTANEAGVILGDSQADIEALDLVCETAPHLQGLTTGLPVGMLRALARHDSGHPDAPALLDFAIEQAQANEMTGPWRFVAGRMLVERGELDRARELFAGAREAEVGPTGKLLTLLAKAATAVAEGCPDVAARHLLNGVEQSRLSGASLLLPEIASRLAALDPDHDSYSAAAHHDLAERSQGEISLGRERFTLLLARAAMLASEGQLLRAAEVAGAAADLTTALGLVNSAAEAARRRQVYLDHALQSAPPSFTGEARKVRDEAAVMGMPNGGFGSGSLPAGPADLPQEVSPASKPRLSVIPAQRRSPL